MSGSPTAHALHAGGPLLRARGLGRRVDGGRWTLRHLEIDVRPGTTTVVLGASGSGKTTLLRLLAGLDPAQEGSVQRPAGLRLTYVHQRPEDALIAETARGEFALGRWAAVGGPAMDDRAAAALMGLDPAMLEADLLHLSGGTRRLVAIAAAAVAHPDVLVLDEPSSGLAPEHRWRIVELLQQRRAAGQASMLATHDMRLAIACATDAVVLDAGTCAYSGPAHMLLHDAERCRALGLHPASEVQAAAHAAAIAQAPLPAWDRAEDLLDWLARTVQAGVGDA